MRSSPRPPETLSIRRLSERAGVTARAAGFVLVTSLILLVVLSLFAVLAMRGSLFNERASGNERDYVIAREAAELALRDAERDMKGQRFDGQYCAGVSLASCGGNRRPTGTRPTSSADADNFWIVANTALYSGLQDAVTTGTRPASVNGTSIGLYSASATADCGKSLWLAADWDANSPAVADRCSDGNKIVKTVIYGEFTGAPNVFGSSARLPRYLIEVFEVADLVPGTTSNRLLARVTAVGFGRTGKDDGTLASVTLQSVYIL